MEKYFEILDMINKEKLDINKLYLLDCLRYSHYGKGTEYRTSRLFKGGYQENWDNYLEIYIEEREVE